MSTRHNDKCDKEKLTKLKNKVVSLLIKNGIDINLLDIKALDCYNGDIRVYTDTNTRVGERSSFRTTEKDIKDGKTIGRYGTRGKHEIKERNYVAFNEEDFAENDMGFVEYQINEIKKYLKDNNLQINSNMETVTTTRAEEIQDEITQLKSTIDNAQSEDKQSYLSILTDLQAELSLLSETEPIIEDATAGDIEPAETEVIEQKNEDLFSNNNFYLSNPDKVLGEIKVENSRYGKPIEIVVGDITALQKINLDYSFLENQTVGGSIITLIKPDKNTNNIDGIINKSEKATAKKAIAKKKRTVETDPSLAVDVMSFEDVYKEYNKDISLEELRVFIWYKDYIGQPLNQKWYDIAEITSEDQIKWFGEEKWLTEKVNEGLLYYYNGRLMPAYLYLAENIYEKYIRLIKSENVEHAGEDAEYIVKTYGQDVYDNQVAALNQVYSTLYDQRLVIGTQGEGNTLKLVPFSEFCRNFMITSLLDEKPFKVATVTAQSSNKYGKPDFFKSVSDYKKTEMKEMSLKDAFSYWLAEEKSNITYKKGVSYADIIKIYVEQGQMPPTSKDADAAEKAAHKAEWERKKEKCRSEGERIFNIFLTEQLKLSDRVKIEFTWNKKYNNYVNINFNKIPVALTIAKDYDIRPEKRDAISFLFNQGSGCLAYDVGLGKSPAAIFIIRQYLDSGYCKRPMLIVPNQTYRQWISEIKKIIPDIKINDLYNLSQDYREELLDENNNVSTVKEKSITILTYEGLERLGFNEVTEGQIFTELYEILNQGGAEEQMSEKQKEGFFQKLQKLIGRGLKDSLVNIEDIGTDFIAFDEAHAMKKLFTSVKGEVIEGDSKGRREKTPYKISSGTPSGTGLKGFMMSQYILRNNHYRNILLLTATPFTNSPLEIFSMLSLVAYKQLQETDLNNISSFFDNYIEMQSELVVTATMKAEYRQVVTGFRNISSLQHLIKRFFDYKDANNVPGLTAIRPTKWVLPLLSKNVDGNIIKLGENERVETYIPMSDLQESLTKDIIAYSEGKINANQLSSNVVNYVESESDESAFTDTEAVEVNENVMNDDEKKGVRIIKSIMYSQNLALSPYLYEHSGLKNPTAIEYVNTSPKLSYVMECIKTVKKYHEDRNEAVSGQIIYMNRGIEYFHLLKQYLVEIVGYQPHEVGMMFSRMKGGKEAKDNLKNLFLGVRYNEQIKSFEKISDEERVKVLIGSGTIKEGMNLQAKSTLLYNCFLDWNPTDIIQLHGRIFRQGNEFKNVRIVNPLMINSVDIFMFQKLEEKTRRINAIWNSDNKTSVLKLEELNPAELKFALIKDPEIIATYKIQDENVRIEDEVASEQSLVKKYEKIIEHQDELNRYRDDVDEFLQEYRPKKFKADLTDDVKVKMAAEVYRTQTDAFGLKMVSRYQRDDYRKKEIKISEKEPIYKPYWFDNVIVANRTIEREKKDYFTPRNLDINKCIKYIKNQQFKINKLEEEAKELNSKENLAVLVEEVKAEKAKMKLVDKSIPQLVSEFERLNYLLSIKFDSKETKAIQEEEFNCVIRDKGDEIRIDVDAIDQLEECIKKVPSTKDMHTVNGEYTEERKALHEQIYEKFASKKVCNENETPIAILTGGAPASGKSTFLRSYAPYLVSDKLYKIDVDEIREELPEYKGWNSQSTHQETRDIMHNYILSDENIGKPCKFDIIYDGTMNSTKNYLPLVGILKRLGYKVFIIYMNNITYDVAIARSLERFKHGKGKTGAEDLAKDHRYVPRSVIADFFQKGKEALNELKSKVDGYMVVDGSSRDYVIIEKGGMELPKDRDYGHILSGGTKAVKEKVDTTKAKIERYIDTIDTYKEMLAEATDKDLKEKYQDTIETYEEMLAELKTDKYAYGGNFNEPLVNTYYLVKYPQYGITYESRVYADSDSEAKDHIKMNYGIPADKIQVVKKVTTDGYLHKGVYMLSDGGCLCNKFDDGGNIDFGELNGKLDLWQSDQEKVYQWSVNIKDERLIGIATIKKFSGNYDEKPSVDIELEHVVSSTNSTKLFEEYKQQIETAVIYQIGATDVSSSGQKFAKGGGLQRNNYRVDFISLDGNKQSVYIGAYNESEAKRLFEKGYKFDEILKIVVDNEQYKKGGNILNEVCPSGMQIQTLLFSKSYFTEYKAKVWAKEHGFKFGKIDEKENTHRLRQNKPTNYKRGSFKTIVLKNVDGIKAVVGCPVKK